MSTPSIIDRDDSVLHDADRAARAATESAGITIRLLDRVEEFSEVVRLFERIWTSKTAQGPINTETLRAISKAGSYLAGAFDGTTLVGACMGFFAAPSQHALHSHIAGVDRRMRGRNVGFALKVHQRAWALTEGIQEISWTFDPLISRNAHFNLVKLGAEASRYYRNYYGNMSDVINAGDDSDRLLVTWDLLSARAAGACHGAPALIDTSTSAISRARTLLEPSAEGEPQLCALQAADTENERDATLVSVGLPRDIENIRLHDPERASRWRTALRGSLGDTMDAGGRVLGFDSAHRYMIDVRALV